MISTNTTQIKLNIPVALKEQVEEIAKSFGYTVSAYIRHLIMEEARERKYPTYEMSDRTKKRIEKSLSGKSKFVEVKNIDDFFAKL